MNQLKLYDSVKHLNLDKVANTKLQLVQGVPGCGKTTFIINSILEQDLVLFPTKEAAADFRTRLRQERPDMNIDVNDSCRTVHSFIINLTNHLKRGGRYRRLVLDEALMLHAGEVLLACALAGVSEALLIGDRHQIPYINRTSHDMSHFNIMEIAEVIKIQSLSYRCTNSVAKLLSSFYEQGMKTRNPTRNEADLYNFNTLESLNIDKDKYKVLVFKQCEKRYLNSLGFNTSTIHEYQGKQAEHVAVIRTSRTSEEIYGSLPHCIVAISRHTKSFLYCTPYIEDTLSKWVKTIKSFTDEELVLHRDQLLNKEQKKVEVAQKNRSPHTSIGPSPYTSKDCFDLPVQVTASLKTNSLKTDELTTAPDRSTTAHIYPPSDDEDFQIIQVEAEVHHAQDFLTTQESPSGTNNLNQSYFFDAEVTNSSANQVGLIANVGSQPLNPPKRQPSSFLDFSHKIKTRHKPRLFINSKLKTHLTWKKVTGNLLTPQ